jgi:hypothetical protein
MLAASSLAAVAAVGYLLLPGSETSVTEPTATAAVREPAAPAPADIPRASSAAPARPRLEAPAQRVAQRGVRASERRSAEPAKPVRPSEHPRVDREPSMQEVTGLTPAERKDQFETRNAVVVSADPARQPKAQPNLGNPLDERWIDDLSGPRARLSMGKESVGGCAACDRAPAPKDMSLVGVVVESEELIKHPEQPLTGEVKRGHYKDHTPAVYVK